MVLFLPIANWCSFNYKIMLLSWSYLCLSVRFEIELSEEVLFSAVASMGSPIFFCVCRLFVVCCNERCLGFWRHKDWCFDSIKKIWLFLGLFVWEILSIFRRDWSVASNVYRFKSEECKSCPYLCSSNLFLTYCFFFIFIILACC